MAHFTREELDGLRRFLKDNYTEIVVIVSASLFFILHQYHLILTESLGLFIYYAVLPLLVIVVILRKNPLDFGLRFGNPRVWWPYVVAICLVAAVILYASSFIPSLQKYYQVADFHFVGFLLAAVVGLFSSEFIYRGFLLFGLREKFKEASILFQMVPFVLLHLGKPEVETLSTLFTGLLFGWVAYRGKSFWPAFIIHLFINIFFIALINYRFPS
jgi:uncharacterized protein